MCASSKLQRSKTSAYWLEQMRLWRMSHKEHSQQYDRERRHPVAGIQSIAPNARRIAAWKLRKEKFGPSGGMGSGAHWKPRKTRQKNTHCKRGHRFTDKNVTIRSVKNKKTGKYYIQRSCIECRKLYNAARRTSTQATDYAKLRQAMIDAHPDKGGSSAKFIAAKQRLDAFKRKTLGEP